METAVASALRHLGYTELRAHQREIIYAYLQGYDALLCSPTGSGKSLTFEIAPLAFKELLNEEKCSVVIVSPLVALMQYQVESLTRKGLKAVYLQETDLSTEELCSGAVQMIFASPESLLELHRHLLTKLSQTGILKAIYIDEAHCIKKFGKADKKKKLPAYRPMYGQLGEIRSLVQRKIPVIALTATANSATQGMIVQSLCMSNAKKVILTPEKKNVKYTVETGQKDICNNFKWLLDLLVQYREKCPRIIIFFRQIKYISEVFEYLQTSLGDEQYYSEGFGVKGNGYWNRRFAMFHLMTNEHIKKTVCKNFREEDCCIRIVLCSTSFSMGLDVKNVHTVVHYGPANDIDDYLQEAGRAGRDPDSNCNAILIKYRYALSSQNVSAEMKNYVRAMSCRRIQLLKPFAANTVSLTPKHNCCDVCTRKCTCGCLCKYVCTCETTCSGTESEVLNKIRLSLNEQTNDTSSSSSEDFSRDSDIERYLHRKPTLVYESSDTE